MTWNHRVVRREYVPIKVVAGESNLPEITFGIHEVYYDDDGTCHLMTEEATTLVAESLDGLKGTFLLMQEAFDKPILNYKDHSEWSDQAQPVITEPSKDD